MSPAAAYTEEPKVIDTTLNFWLDPKLGGHDHYVTGVASYYRRKFDVHPARIEDIRGRQDQFNINDQGFQFHEHECIEKTWDDTERIKREVYPESEALLKEITGATRVHVFSHILRNDSRDNIEKKVQEDPSLADDNAEVKDVVPARFVHIDQSEKGAIEVLEDNIEPELAQKLRKTRWSIINLWRPLKPVLKDPLAFCDARTARDEDLMPIPVFFPSKATDHRYATLTKGDRFELVYLKYDPAQTWYYCDGMRPGECLLVKCYDSIRDGKTARRCPHSAFVDTTSTSDTKRESIEIRCLVFYEDQPLEG